MRLRIKTLLFVLVTVSVLLSVLVLSVSRIVGNNFADIERQATVRTLRDTRSVVATIADEFRDRGTDWSDWDDMATFVADGNSAFAEANLTADGLGSVNWANVVVLRGHREQVYSAGVAPDGGLRKVPAELDALIGAGWLTTDQPVGGFARLGEELHFVASRPVRRSDHSAGPKDGYLITTRHVSAAQVERIRQFTQTDVDILPLWSQVDARLPSHIRDELRRGADRSLAEEKDQIVAVNRMKGISGEPLFDLRVARPKTLESAASSLLSALNQGLLAFGIILGVLCVVAMSLGILGPLEAILNGVQGLRMGQREPVIVRSKDELGELAAAFNEMSRITLDREASLRLVLDSTGDGLVLMSPSGVLRDNASALAMQWFGPTLGADLGSWLPLPERARKNLELALEQLEEDFMPFEVTVGLLPAQFQAGGRTYRLRYHEVRRSGVLTDVLVVVSDATDQVSAELGERDARELQAIGRQALRDRRSVAAFVEEANAICSFLEPTSALPEVRRAIHTLKGNCAIFGIESVSDVCQEWETRLQDDPEDLILALADIRDAWADARSRIETVFGGAGPSTIEVGEVEYEQFLRHLVERKADPALIEMAVAWRAVPARSILERMAQQAHRVAERLDKTIDVELLDDGLRLPALDLGPVLASFIHLIRNAVDHGIEREAQRSFAGKSLRGRLRLTAARRGGTFVLELEDDGAGIDWEAVRAKAQRMGLPAETEADLEEALFSDGLSTALQVTDLSGRGIGLGAVRNACANCGGRLTLASEAGKGVRFRLEFPLRSRSLAA